MPHKGFATITVQENVKNQFTKLAEKKHTTVPRYLALLAEKLTQEEEM